MSNESEKLCLFNEKFTENSVKETPDWAVAVISVLSIICLGLILALILIYFRRQKYLKVGKGKIGDISANQIKSDNNMNEKVNGTNEI